MTTVKDIIQLFLKLEDVDADKIIALGTTVELAKEIISLMKEKELTGLLLY